MFSRLSFSKNFRAYTLWLKFFCCTIPLSCHASVFQQGLDAVKEKDYSLAIEHFNQIVGQGADSVADLPLVYFNLGVCYYRIERYGSANESFKRSMSSNTLLWRSVFNLALVAERQQRRNYAAKLYDRIIIDSDNDRLIDLAKTKLSRLSADSSFSPSQSASLPSLPLTWSGIISAGIGQDEEVIDPQDLNGTGSSDSFYEVYAGVYRPLMADGNQYLLFSGLAYSAQYDSVEDFDVNLLSSGLEYRWRLDKQMLSTGLSVEYSTVGRNDYLLQHALHGSSRWVFDSKAKLLLKYQYRDYKALDNVFDPLAGASHELELTWYSPWIANHRWKGHLFLMDDDRADRMDAGGFTSFSSVRQGLYGAWDYRSQWGHWTVDMEYRKSHYEGRNTLDRWTEKTRNDERYKASLSWQYSISAEWELDLEYEYTENKSNIENYSYQGGVATAGVSYEF